MLNKTMYLYNSLKKVFSQTKMSNWFEETQRYLKSQS